MDTPIDRIEAFAKAREKHCAGGGNLDPERIISFGAEGVVHHVTSADLAEVLRLAKMGAWVESYPPTPENQMSEPDGEEGFQIGYNAALDDAREHGQP